MPWLPVFSCYEVMKYTLTHLGAHFACEDHYEREEQRVENDDNKIFFEQKVLKLLTRQCFANAHFKLNAARNQNDREHKRSDCDGVGDTNKRYEDGK